MLRHTTRATNTAWYQDALELEFQLHIRADGASINTFYHDGKKEQWTTGPTLSDEILKEPAKLESFIAEALRYARSNGAKSLGVILHIADEFATTELKPELNNPAALGDIKEAAILNPVSILEDSTIIAEQASWRVIPYPAAGGSVIGSTITLSKQYAPLIAALHQTGEKENFPIISHAVSAPLVAMMALSHSLTPTPNKPFVAILQYSWFTVLAFFNEHADLRLIRTLQNRGLNRPTGFINALTTTKASLEFIDPDIFIMRLGENVDATLDEDLRSHFNKCRVEIVEQNSIQGIPAWCPEPAISSPSSTVPAATIVSHTFTILNEEKWALQNFLPISKDVVEIYPTRSEMRLLKMLRLARVAVFSIAFLCITYFCFGMVDLISRPEWSFQPSQAEATQARLSKLTVERQRADHWNNLLEDRSKAWTSMESLARMFPENSGMLVKTYSHAAKPDTTQGNARIGFVKEWKITGYARDEALDYLNTINTKEGISAHFSEIATVTGNNSYRTNMGNRNIVVNIRTQENGSYKYVSPDEASNADESTYPFTFDLTITQRFEATDPMAINVSKNP